MCWLWCVAVDFRNNRNVQRNVEYFKENANILLVEHISQAKWQRGYGKYYEIYLSDDDLCSMNPSMY